MIVLGNVKNLYTEDVEETKTILKHCRNARPLVVVAAWILLNLPDWTITFFLRPHWSLSKSLHEFISLACIYYFDIFRQSVTLKKENFCHASMEKPSFIINTFIFPMPLTLGPNFFKKINILCIPERFYKKLVITFSKIRKLMFAFFCCEPHGSGDFLGIHLQVEFGRLVASMLLSKTIESFY